MTAEPHERADELYRRVRSGGPGEAAFVSGEEALTRFGYGALAHAASGLAKQRFLGLGCPWRAGLPRTDDRVLDVGCGGGLDAIIAAGAATAGAVRGIDLRSTLLPEPSSWPANAAFGVAPAERTGVPASWASLVITNGLPPTMSIADAPALLAEFARVLRPGGELRMVVLIARAPEEPGALPLVRARPTGKPLLGDFLRCLDAAGFEAFAHDELPSPFRDPARSRDETAMLVRATQTERP